MKALMATAIMFSLPLLIGCIGDPMAISDYRISPGSTQLPHSQVEKLIDEVVHEVADTRGLQLVETRKDERGKLRDKTYQLVHEGSAKLDVTIHFNPEPIIVRILEAYISRPTRRHKDLAKYLKSRLEQEGLQVKKVELSAPP